MHVTVACFALGGYSRWTWVIRRNETCSLRGHMDRLCVPCAPEEPCRAAPDAYLTLRILPVTEIKKTLKREVKCFIWKTQRTASGSQAEKGQEKKVLELSEQGQTVWVTGKMKEQNFYWTGQRYWGVRHRGSDTPSGAKCPRWACVLTKEKKYGAKGSWQQVYAAQCLLSPLISSLFLISR